MDAVIDPPLKKLRKQQSKRISPKQQHYAELRANGLTQGEAAEKAGYSSRSAAWKADQHPLVQNYIADVQRSSRARSGHTVAVAMAEAADTMEFAREKGNPMAYCKAVELRAKLSGLLIDRVEVFTADLKGALLAAAKRVIEVSPGSYSVVHVAESSSTEPLAEEQ